MATDLERLVVQLSADVRKYDNAMKRAQGITNRTARQIETRFARMNRLASSSLGQFGRGFVGAVAAGFSVRQVGQLIDASTRIQNALKVAGLEGAELTKVYDRLFDSAQRNAAPFEELVQVYSKAAQAGDDLGASQEELLKLTETVAQALRVSGKSAAEASGALLQLGQALGNGVVQAEEYNSLLDGAYPLLQAVAAGLKEAGGSVSALTRLVKDGKVSSEAFFRAALAGAPILDQKLAGSVLTISQRMTRLQTSLIDAAGRFNESSQAAETFGRQIDIVAEFVNSVDFNSLISNIREVAKEFQAGTEAARFFFSEIGRLSGLEALGDLLTGGAGFKQFDLLFGGDLKITSQRGIQTRIDDAFKLAVDTAGELTEEAIRRSAREFGGAASTAKTGRLPSANAGVTPVSLEDYAAPLKNASSKLAQSTAAINEALITTARRFEGFNENAPTQRDALSDFFKSANQNVDPKMTAWCAAFVNSVLATNGLPGTGKLNARSFLNYGTETQDPQPGDLVVLKRGSGNVQGHVGFFMGNAEGGGVRVLGGNQGNEVSEKTFRSEDVLGFRQVPGEASEGLAKSVELRLEQLQIIRETMAALQQETASIGLETSLLGASNAERERQTLIFETLNALQAQGIPITDQLRAAVEAEANARYGQVASYDAAAAASERLRAKQEELQYVQDEISGAFQGALKGLISDLVHGKDATEALTDAVARLADRLLDIALDQLFASIFGGGLGGGGGLLGGLFGFARGGYTGDGGKGQPAGIVHGKEFVVNAAATKKNRALLEAINAGMPGYAKGGFVLPRLSGGSAPLSPVAAAAPQVDARTQIVNTFDAQSFLSQALSTQAGVKTILNAVRAQPGAFKAALQG